MATLTPAQARALDMVRDSTLMESRQDRYSDAYYWFDNGVRLPVTTGRTIDRLVKSGLVTVERVSVTVVGMNAPRQAWKATVA